LHSSIIASIPTICLYTVIAASAGLRSAIDDDIVKNSQRLTATKARPTGLVGGLYGLWLDRRLIAYIEAHRTCDDEIAAARRERRARMAVAIIAGRSRQRRTGLASLVYSCGESRGLGTSGEQPALTRPRRSQTS